MPLFHDTGEGWHSIERWAYATEDELERFLLENPDFIAGERADVWTVWARQVGGHLGNQLDLLGLGSDGSITIVECKLGANREERREVVAQVLEYAAGLWKMELDRFRETFRRQHPAGRDPFELLTDQAPSEAADTGWDVEQAKQICAENLRYGRFRLVVAVDEISDRLRLIVDYVNTRGQGELKLVATEMPRYGGPGAGVVAPVVYGDRAQAPTDRSARDVNPTIEEVLALATPELAPIARALHDFFVGWAQERLSPRANKTSVSYDARIGGAMRNVLQLYPKSAPAHEPLAVGLYIDPRAMVALGMDADERVLTQAAAQGFERRGKWLHVRAADAARLDVLEGLLDAQLLSRIDA
jgi:hypothetical protein